MYFETAQAGAAILLILTVLAGAYYRSRVEKIWNVLWIHSKSDIRKRIYKRPVPKTRSTLSAPTLTAAKVTPPMGDSLPSGP